MTTYEERVRERLEADPVIQELLSDLYTLRAKDGSRIQFSLKSHQLQYRYFQDKKGNMFCWTPHADTQGRFWCWTYKAEGRKGHKTYRASMLEQRANRAAAKRDALQRYKESTP